MDPLGKITTQQTKQFIPITVLGIFPFLQRLWGNMAPTHIESHKHVCRWCSLLIHIWQGKDGDPLWMCTTQKTKQLLPDPSRWYHGHRDIYFLERHWFILTPRNIVFQTDNTSQPTTLSLPFHLWQGQATDPLWKFITQWTITSSGPNPWDLISTQRLKKTVL